jgi:hypothetical protein
MMEHNELILDLQQIPLDRAGIADNLDTMITHAAYLEQHAGIVDPLARSVLEVAPSFILKQLKRLRTHLDDEADIVAWLSRSLMELLFMLRYMYSGRKQYDELIKEQLKDLKDIEKMLYPDGTVQADAPDGVRSFHADMRKLWEEMQNYGIEPEKLKSPKPAKYFTEGSDLLYEYQRGWKIHSKYVHPSVYLLFGKRDFVYGDGARLYFWALAQFYAARNLRDLHLMIQAIP